MSMVYEWREAPEAHFAVIGDPVGHSLSPLMHSAWFRHAGWDKSYVAIRVWIEELEEAMDRFAGLGYVGFNATLPLKEKLAEILPNIDDYAQRAGAVNCVDLRTGRGSNTDGPGFMRTLGEFNFPIGSRVLLLGAGGAARAVALSLALADFEVRIWNRHRERAEKLVDKLGIQAEILDTPDLCGAVMIVNSTAGTSDVELPIDWNSVDPTAVAYDLMYGRSTPFLDAARSNGFVAKNGLEMLVEQGALSMESWTGESVDRSVMLQAVEEAQ